MFDTADLAAFVDADMPGYVSALVGGSAVAGLFRNAYAGALGIDGSAPSLLCAAHEVTTVAQGTTVVVDSVSYTVAGIEPDGARMTRLRLQEA